MDKRAYFVILISVFLLSTLLIKLPSKKENVAKLKIENVSANVDPKEVVLDILRSYPEVVLFNAKYKVNYVKTKEIAGYTFYVVNFSVGNRKSTFLVSKNGRYVGYYIESNGIYQMALYPIEKIKEMFALSLPKRTKKPKVYLFLMSFCPYGNQMEILFEDVLNKIGNYIDFEPVYIYSVAPEDQASEDRCKKIGDRYYCSLHGRNELEEDIIEKAVYKLYGWKVWMNFVKRIDNNCSLNNVTICWKDVAKELNLDAKKIEKYAKENEKDIVEEDYLTCVRYNAFASPTLIVNDRQYNYARDIKYILAYICKAFENPPKECQNH